MQIPHLSVRNKVKINNGKKKKHLRKAITAVRFALLKLSDLNTKENRVLINVGNWTNPAMLIIIFSMSNNPKYHIT